MAALALTGCVWSSAPSAAPTIEVFGPYRDIEADRLAEVLRRFEIANGIEIRYTGSVDFVSDLVRRAGEGNDPPDVAIVPQPGVVARLAGDGRLVPLGDRASQASTSSTMPTWRNSA